MPWRLGFVVAVFTLYNMETVKKPEPFVLFPPVKREIPIIQTYSTSRNGTFLMQLKLTQHVVKRKAIKKASHYVNCSLLVILILEERGGKAVRILAFKNYRQSI